MMLLLIGCGELANVGDGSAAQSKSK